MSPRIRQATTADHNTIVTFNIQIALVSFLHVSSRFKRNADIRLEHLMSQVHGLQETEDLRLDPEIASKGVAALLKDPAKGRYFVLEVGTHA